MKVRTSVTLPQELLKTVDRLVGSNRHRSEFVEAALRTYVAILLRKQQNEHDLEILNRRADVLNKQAKDLQEYQVEL
ncbi:MAG: ribbon-helix-helix protein, CopG family [Pyrinomonadaceae bacterium]|nr:ribbon-helix-helix protein, CopG family [Pyrinomonadaceae bacterium]